ncbi:hypothetical protein DWV00_20420 [Trinickia dinghuensis]|uniref:Uncharacterized protein n=2 Tax=Trinickia dinghuensis TaxID=2291023 RepID=A0A3D8JW49_9BURK|nr:hypothetical protein DWV00_20420 [Trinickia dinghuensis]
MDGGGMPQQPVTPTAAVNAAYQALQTYSTAAASQPNAVSTGTARSQLISSLTSAVDAYYMADTGSTTVNVNDPRYSEAKAQVAAQLETNVAQTMANDKDAPAPLGGFDSVLKSLQPGQQDVAQALQDFLPQDNGPEGMARERLELAPPQSPSPGGADRLEDRVALHLEQIAVARRG